jgi:hypothetical protein
MDIVDKIGSALLSLLFIGIITFPLLHGIYCQETTGDVYCRNGDTFCQEFVGATYVHDPTSATYCRESLHKGMSEFFEI